jgi:hypothetical protein
MGKGEERWRKRAMEMMKMILLDIVRVVGRRKKPFDGFNICVTGLSDTKARLL